jgi:DNA-binding Lrp family transcriptional regulator
MPSRASTPATGWTFLTNHAVTLLAIRDNERVRLSELANIVGVTERTCQRIVNDLVTSGYVNRVRVGRRNAYSLNPNATFRHSAVHHLALRALLDLKIRPAPAIEPASAPPRRRAAQRRSLPGSPAAAPARRRAPKAG